jgi:hypothetical protein
MLDSLAACDEVHHAVSGRTFSSVATAKGTAVTVTRLTAGQPYYFSPRECEAEGRTAVLAPTSYHGRLLGERGALR